MEADSWEKQSRNKKKKMKVIVLDIDFTSHFDMFM